MARKKGQAHARGGGDGPPDPAPPGSSTPVDSRFEDEDVEAHRPRVVTAEARLIAAFEAGRLLNRLGFHLQQAWFRDRDHYDRAEGILGDLGRAVRPLAPPTQRGRFQQEVAGPFAPLMEWLLTGAHSEYLMGCDEELNSDDEIDVREYRESAARQVFEAVGVARHLIESRLDDPARLVFELGIRLDQGLCRPDIHQFLDEVRDAAGEVKLTGPGKKLTPEIVARGSDYPKPYPNLIAITSRSPGEVPADENWAADIVKLLEELDLSAVVPPEDLHAVGDLGADEMTGLIDRLDAGIRAALTPQKSPGKPGVETPPRKRLRPKGEWDEETEARAKLAYDKCCDTSKSYKEILAEFLAVARERRWTLISTINGIKHIAESYAERNPSLPALPSRQGR